MSAALASASRRVCVAESLAQLRSGSAALWQGDQFAVPDLPACPSGYAELDAELPGGGWPHSGLTELLLREAGSGEIRLLAPALSRLAGSTDQRKPGATLRELVWIAPPQPPYAPALQALGLSIERLIFIETASEADAAWAAEQVLRCGAAGAVLWWSRAALPATLRRLHLAAQGGSTPLFALRPWAQQQQSSPAPLRLGLEPAEGLRLRVHLFKRRGPSSARPLLLALPQPQLAREQPSVVTPSPVTEDVVVGPAPALAAA